MPRPMLKRSDLQSETVLTVKQDYKSRNQKKQILDKAKLYRLLRKNRSKRYMEAMQTLDAGGHVNNQNKVDEIINAINEEFPEVEMKGYLLGIVSVCCLGAPYEVHTLNLIGEIITHYQKGQILPYGLEKARSIAIRGGYNFIEVYTDCCRAVGFDGVVSVVNG